MEKFYKLNQEVTARQDLKASDKIILAIIQNYQDINGKAWPGKRTLQSKSGLSGKTVLVSIKRLETAGLLEVERRGNGKSNHYKSGVETIPVSKVSRCNNDTTGGVETTPEAVTKLHRIKTDLLNKTNIEQSSFAFVLKNDEIFHLPQAKLEEYESTYPEIDIAGEFAKAAQWLRDNPGKRKTEKGMFRFLGSWLSRAKPKQEAGERYEMRTPSPEELDRILEEC